MLINTIHENELSSNVQTLKARVELYKGSALERICNCGEVLQEFTVDRSGEGKFFGYGICHKLITSLMDSNKELNITKDHTIEASFGVGSDFIYPFPKFYVEDISRDEETNDLNITAYDVLYKAANHTVNELNLPKKYTIELFVAACASLLDVPYKLENITDDSFSTLYSNGANFDGTENIRSALNAVAEVTQTIYFISSNWELTFKRLDRDNDPVHTINRNNYLEFSSKGTQILGTIAHATELGDNVTPIDPSETVEGVTQYIRDNPFWELRDDIADLVEAAQSRVGGMTIDQFECNWFGNYLIEIGDKISLITKDNTSITSYLLNDSLFYNGAIDQTTTWIYDENSSESFDNPSSLGDVLNQTSAKVDKANREITLLARTSENNATNISSLKISTDSISTSVIGLRDATETALGNINENMTSLKSEVSTMMTKDEFSIAVSKELSNGVDKVSTREKKYTFDDTGLNISDSDSDISTNIDHAGMTVKVQNNPVLVANHTGVNAQNLHATTWITIGGVTQFQKFESDSGVRIGCFWIG